MDLSFKKFFEDMKVRKEPYIKYLNDYGLHEYDVESSIDFRKFVAMIFSYNNQKDEYGFECEFDFYINANFGKTYVRTEIILSFKTGFTQRLFHQANVDYKGFKSLVFPSLIVEMYDFKFRNKFNEIETFLIKNKCK